MTFVPGVFKSMILFSQQSLFCFKKCVNFGKNSFFDTSYKIGEGSITVISSLSSFLMWFALILLAFQEVAA